jgi:hypothetical protein
MLGYTKITNTTRICENCRRKLSESALFLKKKLQRKSSNSNCNCKLLPDEGPLKGYGWQQVSTSRLLQFIAQHITKHAPKGIDTNAWKY